MGKWRNFLGEKYRCENCRAKFVLKERHKDRIVKKEKEDEGGNVVKPVFFVKCPDCGNLIPLADE